MRNVHDILTGKSEGKRPFEASMHKLEEQIKVNPKEQSVTLHAEFIWLRIGSSCGLLWTWK
jgi:hypothetical protein